MIFSHMTSIKKQIFLFCKNELKERGGLYLKETKMLVIRKMEAGEKRDVCRSLGLAQATVTLSLMSSEPRPGPSLAK